MDRVAPERNLPWLLPCLYFKADTKGGINMTRREIGEERYRSKFDEFGLSERFEFLRREWVLDHDKRFWCRCKSCSEEFLSWNDVFKGRQKRLICPKCGAASDGTVMFTRTETAKLAADLYASGLEQADIADRLGCSVSDVGNAAKHYGIVDPNRKNRSRVKSNSNRRKDAYCYVIEQCKHRSLEILDKWEGVRKEYTIRNTVTGETYKRKGRSLFFRQSHGAYRSRKQNAYIDKGISVGKLIERDGLICYLCGKTLDFNDRRWGNLGPDYPTIDHVIPLAKGGRHSWENVRLCCGLCNTTKSAHLMEVEA